MKQIPQGSGQRGSASSHRLYHQFHGNPPKRFRPAAVPCPRELVYLGDHITVTYRSDKRHGGGDGYACDYIHKCAPSTKLYAGEDGRVLVIAGPRLSVNDRGIIH